MGSGAGSTARAVINASQTKDLGYHVVLILTNRADAGIVEVGRGLGIRVEVVANEDTDAIIHALKTANANVLLLAGYLKLLSEKVIDALGGKVLNTHPSLLPAFGGPGMYGRRVHSAVSAQGHLVSGVTLHWVTAEYDRGQIIEQVRVPIPPGASAELVEERVRTAEQAWLPEALSRAVHLSGSRADVYTQG